MATPQQGGSLGAVLGSIQAKLDSLLGQAGAAWTANTQQVRQSPDVFQEILDRILGVMGLGPRPMPAPAPPGGPTPQPTQQQSASLPPLPAPAQASTASLNNKVGGGPPPLPAPGGSQPPQPPGNVQLPTPAGPQGTPGTRLVAPATLPFNDCCEELINLLREILNRASLIDDRLAQHFASIATPRGGSRGPSGPRKPKRRSMTEILDQFFGSDRLGKRGGAAFEIGEVIGDLLGGRSGQVVGTVSKFGKVLFDSMEKLRDWSEMLHQSNMRFAEFSASMASVQVEQEIRDMLLSRERGERRASAARDLAESKSRLERALSRPEDAISRILDRSWKVGISDPLASLVESTNKILEELKLIPKENRDTGEITMNEWMFNIGKEQWYEYYGKPGRLGGRGRDHFKLDPP